MKNLFSGSKKTMLIMDGGLGTTLETTCQTRIADTPLWSAEALSKEPEAIVAAHVAFLRAGARIIETATYQCCAQTFQQAGYDRETADLLMHEAVLLAHQAREIYISERKESHPEKADELPIHVCLSLGPFGATLSPTQEFTGFYPPPFGPRGYSGETDHLDLNYFDDKSEELQVIEALTGFHLERLMRFAQNSSVWAYIDVIAFETVPLVREVVAIRRAMGEFLKQNAEAGSKPWWISSVFPNGEYPQMKLADGTKMSVSDVVEATLKPTLSFHPSLQDLPVPPGLGINCTSMEYLPQIIKQIEAACKELESSSETANRPFLTLYPNGGDVYDVSSGSWRASDPKAKERWVSELETLVRSISNSLDVTWTGVVVGGCCRCGPEQIRHLSSRLELELLNE